MQNLFYKRLQTIANTYILILYFKDIAMINPDCTTEKKHAEIYVLATEDYFTIVSALMDGLHKETDTLIEKASEIKITEEKTGAVLHLYFPPKNNT